MRSRGKVAAFALVVLALAVGARADAVAYVANYRGGTISTVAAGGGSPVTFATGLNYPEGVAFGPDGTLYVAEQLRGVIDAVSPAGVVSPFATIAGSSISGLTSDAAGNLYVSLQDASVIDKVSPAGTVSTYATGVVSPQGLAFDAAGDLYVADGYANRVAKVAPGGGAATTFAPFNSALTGVAVDSAGNVCVGYQGANTVVRYSSAAKYLGRYVSVPDPRGLAFDPAGDLLVASVSTNSIYSVPPGGGSATVYASGLTSPLFLAVAPTAVPEPASVAVLAVAAASLLGRRRLR